MEPEANRRPIKTRAASWPRVLAQKLTNIGLTPNIISILSIVCAAVASALMLISLREAGTARIALLLFAAFFIQLRLLCNLLDGLMAVEGGHVTALGEMFNEFPDRVSDSLILIAAGYVAGFGDIGIQLGWACALLAMTTAYIRAFGAHCTGKQDFRGPMAKQHRMFVMTVGLVVSAALVFVQPIGPIMFAALSIIAAGCVVTCWRRMAKMAEELKKTSKDGSP